MATSALVCINLKTRGKSDGGVGEGGSDDRGEKEIGGGGPNTQQLVQALVDNGIIQLNHKATIRVIEGGTTSLCKDRPPQELSDFKTLSLGTFAVRQSPDTRSGILLETVGEGSGGAGEEQKLVIHNRPAILVQRNLVLGNPSSAGLTVVSKSGSGVLQLVQHTTAAAPPETPPPSLPPASEKPPPPPPTPTSDGEPIKLPENLESLPKAEHFPTQRHRWNTNEEIAAILICFERHMDWQSKEVKIRPKSGSMLLYSRKKVRYRRDGYCWKKRKDGKTTREDHMKLKVQGTECIYGCYVHSAILPTFHRRCYWLLQNPDIVLVHYLNVPYPDDNKLVSPSLALCADKKQWTKEELVSQLKPMFYSEEEPELNNELEISTAETVETIVSQLLERQRSARASAICKQLECGCPDSTCTDAKTCTQPIRRISAAKTDPSSSDSNQVSSTTGSGMLVAQRSMVHHQERQVPVHSTQTNHHNVQQNANAQSGNAPLVLNLSQIQGSGSLLILNSNQHGTTGQGVVTSLVTSRHQRGDKHKHSTPMEMDNSNSCQITQRVMAQERRSISLNHMNNNHSGAAGSNSSSRTVEVTEKLDNRKYEVYATKQNVKQHQQHQQTQQQSSESDGKSSYLSGHLKESSGGYYETLDLSQEDIQQTLQANMPMSCTASETNRIFRDTGEDGTKEHPGLPLEIDFIDVNAPQHVDDDVFVNLDAFDMLSEFPELEGLDHNHNSGGHMNDVVNNEGGGEVMDTEKDNNSPQRMDYREGTANITDFSPEWAYTEGGVKVLVTGPWYSTTSPYTVLFDSVPVPTTLVQSGVLRCYCPAHEAGLVTLQVACEGFVISNSAMFEYKRLPRERSGVGNKVTTSSASVGDSLLRYTLMQRLDAVDHNLEIKQEPHDLVDGTSLLGHGNLEEKLVSFVQKLNQSQWRDIELRDTTSIEWCESFNNMTLLHLAASQGYSRLVCALIQWRNENPSSLLDIEVDGFSQDSDGYTPLMWACRRGHTETAILLNEWLPAAISLLSKTHLSAVDIARSNGHTTLASELQRRLNLATKGKDFLLTQSNLCLSDSPEHDIDGLDTHSSLESLNRSRDDGIFLRPLTITRNESQNSLELHVNIPSGVDGQITCSRLSSPSPSSVTDIQTNSKSLVGERLIKRPSVDSGIQLQSSMDSLPSLRSTRLGKNNGRDTPKLSRFDRSMSLPLSTPMSCLDTGYDSINLDSLRHSPGRRMDFALCELRPGTTPPSPDSVMLLSTEEEDAQQSVGEQDVRVLTLAEQIIAAMPERIKNESEGDMMILGSDDMEVMSLESPLLLDEPPSSSSSCCFDTNSEFNFDHSYRYYDVGTPCSSLSPGSCLPSPSFPLPHSPSPPPTTADFCEFLQASNSTYFEKDFSNLTLSDQEQRELYEAAKVIQKAYRSYKGRKKVEQDKERQAAVLIQNYYRRYKQYAYFKQMTRAAMVIQNGYRSYCENKRFKKNQEQAVRLQNSYRNESTTAGLKRTYSQRRQHQAARKIQQFMRQSKNKLQKERAEKERQGPCKVSPQN